MLVQEQNKKVIFDMKHYSFRRFKNKIKIYDKNKQYIGVLAEYTDSITAEHISKELKNFLEYCLMNDITCVFPLPMENEAKQVIFNEQQ